MFTFIVDWMIAATRCTDQSVSSKLQWA